MHSACGRLFWCSGVEKENEDRNTPLDSSGYYLLLRGRREHLPPPILDPSDAYFLKLGITLSTVVVVSRSGACSQQIGAHCLPIQEHEACLRGMGTRRPTFKLVTLRPQTRPWSSLRIRSFSSRCWGGLSRHVCTRRAVEAIDRWEPIWKGYMTKAVSRSRKKKSA